MSASTALLETRTVHRTSSAVPAAADEPVRRRTVWMPWITDGCIATRDQEIAFVDHLRLLSLDPFSPHSRSDATVCLNALRGGLTVGELLERCPGVRPERLAAAYAQLEHRRGVCERAWSSIVDSGSVSALVEHGDAAATLIPAVVGRLVSAAHNQPDAFATTVLRLAENVDNCRREAYRVEHELARCVPGSSRARQLSAVLYQPFSDAIATRDDFLPDRVGTLNPTRVAALLGELVSGTPVPDSLSA